jgi:hypothetical protein
MTIPKPANHKMRKATMRPIILLLLLVVGHASATNAQPGHHEVFIPGFGQDSCGRWIESRRVRNTDWTHEVAWLQGFVAGHNWYTADQKAAMTTAEPLDVALWLDRFCAVNPLSGVGTGAAAYIEAKGGPKSRIEWKRP